MEANAENILDPNNLTVGSVIPIPTYSPPPTAEGAVATEAGAPAAADSGNQESIIT